MSHPSELLTTGVVLVAGLVTLVLAGLALKARMRTGNNQLSWVAGAFGVFAFKSFLIAWALQTGGIDHEHLEALAAILDLCVVALLVVPIFFRP